MFYTYVQRFDVIDEKFLGREQNKAYYNFSLDQSFPCAALLLSCWKFAICNWQSHRLTARVAASVVVLVSCKAITKVLFSSSKKS